MAGSKTIREVVCLTNISILAQQKQLFIPFNMSLSDLLYRVIINRRKTKCHMLLTSSISFPSSVSSSDSLIFVKASLLEPLSSPFTPISVPGSATTISLGMLLDSAASTLHEDPAVLGEFEEES